MSGFAANGPGGSTKPAEQRRCDLIDRGKPSKPALWNDARVRPLGLDPVPVALCKRCWTRTISACLFPLSRARPPS